MGCLFPKGSQGRGPVPRKSGQGTKQQKQLRCHKVVPKRLIRTEGVCPCIDNVGAHERGLVLGLTYA